MLTRQYVTPQYHGVAGASAAPPHDVAIPVHQQAPGLTRNQLYGGGGLMGGAVTLTAAAPTGQRVGDTGYGYLGMDPSAPETWMRRFNPAPGMIAFLNHPGYAAPAPTLGHAAVNAED